MRYLGSFVDPAAFVSPSVAAQKVYQIRAGVPPQGPVEELIGALPETVVDPIREEIRLEARAGVMPVVIGGLVGMWLISTMMGRRRR